MNQNNNKVKRIYYGKENSQFGDLRLPTGNGPFPLIVIIHGGFWKAKYDLEHLNDFAEAFTEHNLATWNIEYRRVGETGGGWPGTFFDIANAIDYIDILAEQFPIDKQRVIAIGHSAGGHLALWAAARKNIATKSEIKQKNEPFSLSGVIGLAAVSDLEKMHDIHHWEEKLFGSNENPTYYLIGKRPNEAPERYQAASPHHLLPIETRIVLIHGELDVDVPYALSKDFYERARRAGDEIELIGFPTLEHFAIIQRDTESWSIVLQYTKKLLGVL